jgi:hypothetical protein
LVVEAFAFHRALALPAKAVAFRDLFLVLVADGPVGSDFACSRELKGVSDHALGQHLRERGCIRAWVQGRRGWQFPPLEECRKRWIEQFPATAWLDKKTTEWTSEGD